MVTYGFHANIFHSCYVLSNDSLEDIGSNPIVLAYLNDPIVVMQLTSMILLQGGGSK